MQQQAKFIRRHSGRAQLFFAFLVLTGLFFQALPAFAAAPDWRALVAAKSSNLDERGIKLLQARQLFAAELVPQLVRAGYGSVDEFVPNRDRGYGYYDRNPDKIDNNTKQIVDALWYFAPFPKIVEELVQGLKEQELSRGMRLKRFNGILADLVQVTETFRQEDHSYPDVSDLNKVLYWLTGEYATLDYYGKATPASPKDAAIYREKLKFLNEWLPYLLASYTDDAPTAHLVKMEELGLEPFMPWGDDHGYADSPAWNLASDRYERTSFAEAMFELWKMRGDKAALDAAKKLMNAPNTLPEQRWNYIVMTARYPGRSLAEYAKLGPMMSGISSMDSCWVSMSSSGKYGLSFGGCEGAAFDSLLNDRHTAPRVPMAATPEAREPGINLKKLPAKPTLAALKAAGPLYMVAESSRGPKFFDAEKEQHYRIFTREALYYMDSGPRLYPLDLKKESHLKLLTWYLEEGATGGGHTLISSRAKPENIVKSLENWYLVLWDDTDSGPRLVLTFGNSGNLLRFFFERLGGQSASLFMGGIDAVWFQVLGRESDDWHEARPARLAPLAESKLRPALVILSESNRAFGTAYTEEKLLRQVIRLRNKYPQNGLSRAEGAAFLEELNGRISASYPDLDGDSYTRSSIKEMLWEFKGTPQEEKLRGILLIEGDRDDARAAVDAAEESLKQYRDEQKKKAKEKGDA